MEPLTQSTIYETLSRHGDRYLSDQEYKYTHLLATADYEVLSQGYLLKYMDEVTDNYQALSNISIPEFRTDVRGEILAPYSELIKEFEFKMEALETQLQNELQSVHDSKAERVRNKMEEAERLLESLFDSVRDMEEKHQYILSNKERIVEIMRLYNINPSEYEVDLGKMEKEEINDLFRVAEYALTITVNNSRITDKALGLLYKPLDLDLEDSKDSAIIYSHFAALILVAYVAKPYFFGVVGALYILRFVGNTFRVRDKKKLLSLAYNLAQDFDFRKEFYNNPKYLQLLSEAECLEDEDISSELEYVQNEYEKEVDDLSSESPYPLYDESERTYNSEIQGISDYMAEVSAKAYEDYRASLNKYRTHLDSVKTYLEEIAAKWEFLGDSIKLQRTLDLNFRSAVYQSEATGVSLYEDFIEMDLANYVFKWSTDDERAEQIEHMKYWILNALSNVKEKHISLDIVDKKGAGRDLSEFLDPTLSKVATYNASPLMDIIDKDVLPKIRANISKMGNKNIQEYNAAAEESGLVTIDYRVIAVLSSDEADPALTHSLRPLMEYSAQYGIFFLVLMKDESAYPEDRGRDDVLGFDKNCCVSKTAYEITKLNGTTITFDSDQYAAKSYRYSYSLSSKVIKTLIETIEADRADKLDYETGYRKIHIPDEKVWSWSTRKGIELRFGYLDGDPTKPYGMSLGDDAVHCLMAGATGAGKSATINQIIANLLYMYPPEELEMVMIDFKNVEFAMYTGDNTIPHAKIISGTKDGEYAVSVFDYLIKEMDRRTEIFAAEGVQKLEDYNNIVEERGDKHLIMPRILFLIDEYQVMFTEVPDKILDIIRERITSLSKLARFCGCHMWFTSQSMKGTMGPDIMDQFKLRAALGCSDDVSIALIGNNAASRNIKSKGFIYTNHTAGMDETANKLWRIPFIPGETINSYLPKLNALCAEQGRIHRKADFYNEKTLHYEEDFHKSFEIKPDVLKEEGFFMLGERTSFSLNRLPVNFKMVRDDGEHILCSMFERDSMLNMASTFLANLEKRKDDISYAVHCADGDTIKLLDLENRVPEKVRPLVDTRLRIEDIVQFLQANIDNRKANPELVEKEMYFLGINWEKMDKIGRNADFGAGEKFKLLLQEACILNIHIIILTREVKEMRQLLGLFNHKFISYHNDNESMNMLEDGTAKGLSSTFCTYSRGSVRQKFKLYQFPLKGKLSEREVVA